MRQKLTTCALAAAALAVAVGNPACAETDAGGGGGASSGFCKPRMATEAEGPFRRWAPVRALEYRPGRYVVEVIATL